MGSVSTGIDVPGRVSDAEALWYDHRRWPTFVDGFAHVAKVEGDWPRPGARLVWTRTPGGRGRVVEEVTAYEARGRADARVEDEQVHGTQRVALRPRREDGARVTLELEWRLKQQRPLMALVDVLFVRRQLREALERTLRASARSSWRVGGRPGPIGSLGPPVPTSGVVSHMFVFKAAVVGAGTMGGQIAQTIAAAGIPVVLKDVKQELVDAGLTEARNVTQGQIARLVKKGKLTEEQAAAQVDEVVGRIQGTTTYEGFGDVDFVIEAVPERMEIKQAVFAELDAVTPGHAILASNTSSLSITEIGEATLRPDKVVGFHYFYPAAVMPLIEVIQGDDTSAETVQAAVNFAQAIKKQPIICAEVPGFVVNRILNSGIERDLARPGGAGAVDQGDRRGRRRGERRADGAVLPHRPARPGHRAARRRAPARVLRRPLLRPPGHAAAGRRGQARRQDRRRGLLRRRRAVARRATSDSVDGERLAELLTLKSFVEACLVLEEGVATHRDIDFGLMAGAGLDPRRGLLPPFMKADVEGLDVVLERLEQAAEEHGERFAPPTILRRLVAQGRLGQKTGQGFYAYPQPDDDAARRRGRQARDARRRRDRLAGQRPDELDRAAGHRGPRRGLGEGPGSGGVRALVIASSNPLLFCAGADIKAFTQMDEAGGARAARQGPRAVPRAGRGGRRHDRRGQRPGLRRRLRAGDGLRRAHRRPVGDLRPARDQARDHPRLRRHPAPAAARGGEQGARDEPRRRRRSAPTRPTSSASSTAWSTDHELLDTALRGRASSPSRRRSPSSRSSRSRARATSTRASRPRRGASRPSSPARTRKEGISAFLGKRKPDVAGPLASTTVATATPDGIEQLAELVRAAESVVALTGAGSRCRPGSRTSARRAPGCGRTSTRWRSPTSTPGGADPERFWHFYGERFQTLDDKQPNGAHRALVELERRGKLDAVITQNIDMLHRQAGTRGARSRSTARSSTSSCLACGAEYPLDGTLRAPRRRSPIGVPRCDCGEPLKPDVVLFGEWLPEGALERAYELAARRRPAAVRRLVAGGPPDRAAARA